MSLPIRISRREALKIITLAGIAIPASFFHLVRDQEENIYPLSQPNILIIVFDTLSARHMSLYGYPRRTTPNLERICKNAIVFHNHHAAGNFTTPGTASLLTGVYPWSHRALSLRGKVLPFYSSNNIFSMFDDYYTFAYTHNPVVANLLWNFQSVITNLIPTYFLAESSTSHVDRWLNRDFMVANEAELALYRNWLHPQGSLFYSQIDWARRFFQESHHQQQLSNIFPRGVPRLTDEDSPSYLTFTIERTIDWLIDHLNSSNQPFLGYIHLLPPHEPYTTRREFYNIFQDAWKPQAKPNHFFTEGWSEDYLNQARQFYDEAIAYVDSEFGRFFDAFQNTERVNDTIVILTSDHGEMFERGIDGHITPVLYAPLTHIPLLIWAPGIQQRIDIHSLTNAVDILPGVLTLAGKPIPSYLDGYDSFTRHISDINNHRSIFIVESSNTPINKHIQKATLAIMRGKFKLIYYMGYPEYDQVTELYDMINDPEEMTDLSSSLPELAKSMKNELIDHLQKAELSNNSA